MRGWLARRISIARGTLLVIAFGIGMLGAGGIIVGTIALQNVSHEAQTRQRVDRLTTRDVEKIARRIFRIEQPSRAELLRRITEGIRLCARTPVCAGRVRRVAGSSSGSAGAADATGRAPAAGDVSPSTPTTRRPDRRHGSRPGGGDGSPSTGDTSRPPGGGQPSPGPAPAPVSVTTPAPLQGVRVCTPLVAVNC